MAEGRVVYRDSLAIVGREMIDNLPDPGPTEQNILTKMARVTRMARTVARMAPYLADFADLCFVHHHM